MLTNGKLSRIRRVVAIFNDIRTATDSPRRTLKHIIPILLHTVHYIQNSPKSTFAQIEMFHGEPKSFGVILSDGNGNHNNIICNSRLIVSLVTGICVDEINRTLLNISSMLVLEAEDAEEKEKNDVFIYTMPIAIAYEPLSIHMWCLCNVAAHTFTYTSKWNDTTTTPINRLSSNSVCLDTLLTIQFNHSFIHLLDNLWFIVFARIRIASVKITYTNTTCVLHWPTEITAKPRVNYD